jgi:hypothetical protein
MNMKTGFTLAVIMIMGLFAFFPQNLIADQSKPPPNASTCCPPSQAPASEGIGKYINGFFAFGCCLNYRLTDWILSDKCDAQQRLCDFSQDKPLCEQSLNSHLH